MLERGIIGVTDEAVLRVENIPIDSMAGESYARERFNELHFFHPKLHSYTIRLGHDIPVDDFKFYLRGAGYGAGFVMDSLKKQPQVTDKEIDCLDDEMNGYLLEAIYDEIGKGANLNMKPFRKEIEEDSVIVGVWVSELITQYNSDPILMGDFLLGFATVIIPFIRRGYQNAIFENLQKVHEEAVKTAKSV